MDSLPNVCESFKWFCQESTLQTAKKKKNSLTTGFWNNLKCHSRKWVWGKKRGKKHDAELRFEATETDENLPENGNFGGRRKKKKANMIKSVSQWLVAFSRHGERRVKIRAPREKPLVTPAAKTVLRILPAGERSESLGETTWTAVWWQNKTLLEVFGAPLTLPTSEAMKCQDLKFDCEQQAPHSPRSQRALPHSTVQQCCTNMSAAASREPF